MPEITSIKPQKNKKRVNIYLDGKFAFGLDLENFVSLGLKVEQELSDKEVVEIVKKSEFQKTFDKLLRFVTIRPRSKKEIDLYLRRKKIHISLHKDLFNRLKKLEFIDDYKFARWWVEQRNAFKPRGKRALLMELRQKGVEKDTTLSVLSEVEIDEQKIATELLLKKKYKWVGLDKNKAKQRMYEFLARKGFEWGVIEKAIKGVLK
ncbi:regulatory protein RecX [Patescibacteria group bacterium]